MMAAGVLYRPQVAGGVGPAIFPERRPQQALPPEEGRAFGAAV